MPKPHITIIGLGLIGSSLGLALKASDKALQVVGHDIDPGRNRLAQKQGAIDEGHLNLPNACREADLVVIATPLTALRETLEVIAPHLKENCVVTDTATLKEPPLAWAAETLPETISFVGGHPTLNPAAQTLDLTGPAGPQSARADLFQEALYFLCPTPRAAPTAVKRVTDMVNLIQAQPFYVDPAEHDEIQSTVSGLPTLLGLALLRQAAGTPDWREARRLADQTFGMATASLAEEAAAQQARLLLNQEHLLPQLDALMAELARLREWVATPDGTALEEAFAQAASLRDRWLADRALANWDEELGEIVFSSPLGALGGEFGFGSSPQTSKDE